jgi:hypothetical protein
LNISNKIHCGYLIGLGELGLGNTEKAISAFKKVLDKDNYHLPAFIHLNMAKKWNRQYQNI